MATEPNNLQENIVTDTLTVNEGITLKEGAKLKMPNGTSIIAVASNGQSATLTGTETIISSEIDPSIVQLAEVTITKANILAMNATPVEVVPSPGAGKALQFLDATLIYDRATATYGGGGDVVIAYDGGATVSSTIDKTNCFGAGGDKVYTMNALNTDGGFSALVNTGLVIKNGTGAFTDPGTAAGVGRLKLRYRVITTGL